MTHFTPGASGTITTSITRRVNTKKLTPLLSSSLLKKKTVEIERESMASSRLCDSCKSTTATLFCRADAAFLCGDCDGKIHTANKLASRHERVWLCEVCEQAPAHVTCKADAAALCVTCDRDIHSANPLSRRHERVPITPFYDTSPAKSASSSINFVDEDGGDVSASWLLHKEGIEITNLFSDLDYPKMEVTSENSSGNDGVVPVQKTMFLNEDYFNFDLSASKVSSNEFNFINQTVRISPSS